MNKAGTQSTKGQQWTEYGLNKIVLKLDERSQDISNKNNSHNLFSDRIIDVSNSFEDLRKLTNSGAQNAVGDHKGKMRTQ